MLDNLIANEEITLRNTNMVLQMDSKNTRNWTCKQGQSSRKNEIKTETYNKQLKLLGI